MKIDIITLFPEMFEGPLRYSMIGKAQESGLVKIEFHNLRKWGLGKYKQVDDRPFGGGAGMVLMIEPIFNALKSLETKQSYVVALSAKGQLLKQSIAKELATKTHLILLAGHYEGFDQRILDYLTNRNISIGNYVLTGGELPTMVLTDAIIRLLPGVLGNDASPVSDSYYEDDVTIQYPQFTRPASFELDATTTLKVPGILLGGNHLSINKWRLEHRKQQIE